MDDAEATVNEVALWLTGLLGPEGERKLAEQLCSDFVVIHRPKPETCECRENR